MNEPSLLTHAVMIEMINTFVAKFAMHRMIRYGQIADPAMFHWLLWDSEFLLSFLIEQYVDSFQPREGEILIARQCTAIRTTSSIRVSRGTAQSTGRKPILLSPMLNDMSIHGIDQYSLGSKINDGKYSSKK